MGGQNPKKWPEKKHTKTCKKRFQKTIIFGFAATVFYKCLIECLNFKLVLGSRAPAGAILYPKKDARTQPKKQVFFFQSLWFVVWTWVLAFRGPFGSIFCCFRCFWWFVLVFHGFPCFQNVLLCFFHVFSICFPWTEPLQNGKHGPNLGGPSTKSQAWV